MKKLLLILFCFTSKLNLLFAQTYPAASASGLKFWIKNETGITLTAGAVSAWADQSGAAVTGNMTQATASQRPTVITGDNYNEFITFDGVNDLMGSTNTFAYSGIFAARDNTILFYKKIHSGVVDFKWATAATGSYRIGGEINSPSYRWDFSSDLGGGTNNSSVTNILGNSKIYTLTMNNTTSISSVYFNTVLDGTKNVGSLSMAGAGATAKKLYIGADDPVFGFGLYTYVDFGEMMVINRLLTAAEQRMVESYLAIKYGVTLGTSGSPLNYTSSGNATIWTATGAYQNNIIGIGRDNAATGSSLNTRQSHTTDDTVRLYLGTLVALNRNNASAVTNNLSFIIAGANTGKMYSTTASKAEVPGTCGSIYSRLEREWRIQNTNFTDSYNMDFTLNSLANPGTMNVASLVLLVDDDGNFSNGGTTCYANGASGISFSYSNPVITVSGINTTHIPSGSTRFITIASSSSISPLPIELIRFNALFNGTTTDISWETASEINNNYFTVERSTDGINFSAFTTVPSKGLNGNSASVLSYTLNDPNTVAGVYYYRLKQTDFDFKYTYSNVVVVTIVKNIGFSFDLAPNPNDGNSITGFITTPTGGMVTFKIYTTAGTRLCMEDLQVKEGEKTPFKIPFKERLDAGTYIVIAILNGDLTKKKLMIVTR